MKKRQKMKLVRFDLSPTEARKLAKKVFNLQTELGLAKEQMAADSGLTVEQLYRLRCIWVSGKSRQPRQLLAKFANALIIFWNKHLETEPKQTKRKRPATLSDESVTIIKILIEEHGVKKARQLAVSKRKGRQFDKYLSDLPTKELLELINSDPKVVFRVLIDKEGLKITRSLMAEKGQTKLFTQCLRQLPAKKLAELI